MSLLQSILQSNNVPIDECRRIFDRYIWQSLRPSDRFAFLSNTNVCSYGQKRLGISSYSGCEPAITGLYITYNRYSAEHGRINHYQSLLLLIDESYQSYDYTVSCSMKDIIKITGAAYIHENNSSYNNESFLKIPKDYLHELLPENYKPCLRFFITNNLYEYSLKLATHRPLSGEFTTYIDALASLKG
jgi:hypothetical protein